MPGLGPLRDLEAAVAGLAAVDVAVLPLAVLGDDLAALGHLLDQLERSGCVGWPCSTGPGPPPPTGR